MQGKLLMRYPSAWHGDMWREAAPCGNGLIGAAVYGGVKNEIILVNHAYLWRGGKTVPLPDVSDVLPKVRETLFENKPEIADSLISAALRDRGYDGEIAMPLPLGDILIDSNSTRGYSLYRREIDMEKGEVTVSWTENDTQFMRRTFVSRENNLIFTEISCDKPIIDISVSFAMHDSETAADFSPENQEIYAKGETIYYAAENQSDFHKGDYGAVCRVITSGKTLVKGNFIEITGAGKVLIVTKAFIGSNRQDEFLKTINGDFDYDTELEKHIILHGGLYNKVSFEISDTHTSNEELLLEAFDGKTPDELIEKLYAYGRYLFICATSDKNTLPCHLIGLWNGSYQCFWAIYMYNINFEMIYWQTLSGNLPEFLRLALDYTWAFMDDFRENAKKMFGCRGIFINSVNTPESGLSKCPANHIVNWTTGAAWFSQHFWDYYRYTGDLDYLKTYALPFMAEAALFFEDFLTEDADGYYIFAPSVSPENTARNVYDAFGYECETCINATMDIAVVKELLTNLKEGSRITGLYSDKLDCWDRIIGKLPPYALNTDSAVKEWTHDFYLDNYQHRHHSHIYPVFPGHEVTKTHPQYPAFEKAEDLRMQFGLSDQSSWSMIFMACIAARMGKGARALLLLETLAQTCLMNNLFTVHNDWRRMGPVSCADFRVAPFQIDANIGIPAAINDMLMYSYGDTIDLLPALPPKWKKGKIEGLLAHGGIICDIAWNEKEVRAVFRSDTPQKRTVIYAGCAKELEINDRTEVCF